MRHVVTGINQWTLGVVRNSAGVFAWTQEDLSRIDVKTRKILKNSGRLNTRPNVARLNLTGGTRRTTRGRRLTSVEDCETSNEPVLKPTKSEDFLIKMMAKESMNTGRVKISMENPPAQFAGISDSTSWLWMASGSMKNNAETMITAAQDQALQTNWITANIDNIDCSLLCKVCYVVDESNNHDIATGWGQIAKRYLKADMILQLPGYIETCVAYITSSFARTAINMSHLFWDFVKII